MNTPIKDGCDAVPVGDSDALAVGRLPVLRAVASTPARDGVKRRLAPLRRGLARRQPAAIAAYAGALALAALVLVNPLQITVVLALCIIVLLVAGLGRAAWPYLKTGLFIGGFLAVLNPLISNGGSTVLWQINVGIAHESITIQGIAYGLTTALRIIAVIMTFALFTLVLDADDQLDLMSRLSFRTGLIFSLASRLLPVFSRDATRISDAQRARGVELDAGRRRARIAARVPLLAALLAQSLERAVDIAASMEARGFGARERSRWSHGRRWRAADVLVTAAALAAAVTLIGGLVTGSFSYTFYPLLDDPWIQLASVWWLLALAALAVPLLWTLPWPHSQS